MCLECCLLGIFLVIPNRLSLYPSVRPPAPLQPLVPPLHLPPHPSGEHPLRGHVQPVECHAQGHLRPRVGLPRADVAVALGEYGILFVLGVGK